MVEAAGVEPASEKAPRKKATCVSGSAVFVRPIRYRQEWTSLSPMDLGFQLQAEALYPACRMTPLDRVQAHRPGAAA
jgi:hypothetical protein